MPIIKDFVSQPYSQDRFLAFLNALFGSFEMSEEKRRDVTSDYVKANPPFTKIEKLNEKSIRLGEDELDIFIFHTASVYNKVAIHTALRNIIKNSYVDAALAVFIDKKENFFRFSLVTYLYDKEAREARFSPIKRQSFVLGENIPTATANSQLQKLLVSKNANNKLTLESFQNAFAIEPVTKKFYDEISEHYNKLLEISLPENAIETDKSLFAIRLISRILFCKFLEKKELIPSEIWEINPGKNYYSDVLEPLFFETLNKAKSDRPNKIKNDPLFAEIPYLNGGLFAAQSNDFKGDENLEVSNELLSNLLETLKGYHFTIDENSPTEQEIALDPEMLGRVFENLLASITSEANPKDSPKNSKNNKRKETGSFYTPREIVTYMVKNALYCTLKTDIDSNNIAKPTNSPSLKEVVPSPSLKGANEVSDEAISKQESNPLHELIFNHDDSAFGEGPNLIKRNLAENILALKVLDPACGSGAFPMGILHEICSLLELLDPECEVLKEAIAKDEILGKDEKLSAKTPKYLRKLYTLKNIIYGVDIQPMATEIARLRAFLSLIIDEQDDKDSITPLPNLEFKFVSANSLLPLENAPKKGQQDTATYYRAKLIAEIKKIRQETFSTTNKEHLKTRYKDACNNAIAELAAVLGEAESTIKLQHQEFSYDPFNSLSIADFFDSNFMFGVESFDIIIGNPPYIRHELMGKDLKEKLSKHSVIFNATSDIYTYFYELGATLAPGGTTCLITSNKYARTGYGRRLRDFLLRQKILSYTELNGLKIFNATVDTSILIFKNTAPKKEHLLKYSRPLNAWDISSNIAQDFKQSDLDAESFTFLDAKSIALKAKIERIGVPLKEWDISINYGIKTGLNEAFIIDSLTREEILKSCQSKDERERTDRLIRPMLRGKDIKRYCYKWAELYLINTHNGYTDSNGDKIPPIDIEQYPTLKAHLDKHKEKLQKREDKGATPYNLRNCAYLPDFEKPKIVWNPVSGEYLFSYITDEIYFNNSLFMITSNSNDARFLKYVLGLLNSTLYKWIIVQMTNLMSVGVYAYGSKEKIEKLPIPKITESNKHLADEIIKIVEQILKSKEQDKDTTELESEIDKKVYELYNLTDDEKNLIDPKS